FRNRTNPQYSVSASGSILSSAQVVLAKQLSLSRDPDATIYGEKGGLSRADTRVLRGGGRPRVCLSSMCATASAAKDAAGMSIRAGDCLPPPGLDSLLPQP